MTRTRRSLILTIVAILMASAAPVVQASPADPRVPPVVMLTGEQQGVQGAVAVTIALYAEQNGGAPLWTEAQPVIVDAGGRYAVTVGAASPGGLPLALFAGNVTRWVGVTVDGQPEQPRVMLVSVPYALKAADADTVGGKPLSAFVLAGDTTGIGADGLTYVDRRVLTNGLSSAGRLPQVSSGSPGFIGKFTNSTDLGNSALFQSGSNVGLNTVSPQAPLHSVASVAAGALFDTFSNSLAALPLIYRTARGTPTSPSAVQTDDILGGLAVRAWGTTGFSLGRAQLIFRAAEPWTDAANGTYLTMTTTPTGAALPLERLRISPAGYVGVGASNPQFPLDVQLARGGATFARFGTDSPVPLFIIAGNPHLGFNAYFDGGYNYGRTGYAGYLAFNQGVLGAFTFATAPSGAADAPATLTTRMTITNGGLVGIGTTSPATMLDVAGSIHATADVAADGAGVFATGVQAGPGMTGTPLAHGVVGSAGNFLSLSHSTNVGSVTRTGTGAYDIAITGEVLDFQHHTAMITMADSGPGMTSFFFSFTGHLILSTFDSGGAVADRAFTFVIFKM